jgi:hypothetical protein
MTEAPKIVPSIVPSIVYDRLRAASSKCALPGQALPEQLAPEPAHPDADLLTAFAEQALSEPERDGVLAHLALCGDCREVVALSLPAADLDAASIASETESARATPIPAQTERNSPAAPRLAWPDFAWAKPAWAKPAWAKFAWPSLRWAALAAGILVVATVLMVHPGKRNEATLHPAKPPVATPAPSASGSEIASLSTGSSPIAPSPTVPLPKAPLAKTNGARPNPQLHLSNKLKPEKSVAPPAVESEMLLADNQKDAGEVDELSAASPVFNSAFDARTTRGATETVEVSGAAANLVEVEPSAEARLMVHNEMSAAEIAKPALPKTGGNARQKTEAAVTPAQAGAQARTMTYAAKLASPAGQPLAKASANAMARNVTWTIAAGVLQRSLDSGQSWQNVLRADRPLLCYASHGEDMWTGGQAGTLFHSTDSGVTWAQVQPSIPGKTLSSDITHIDVTQTDVPGPAQIFVSTSNNEIWSSANGGKTWEKTWKKK